MEVLGDAVQDVPSSESLIGLYEIDNQVVENSLHRHVNHELVAIVRGSGTVRIGSHEGDFAPGTVAFIKAGTNHCWRSDNENAEVTAVFLHIPKSVFSPSLWKLPETAGARTLISGDRAGAICRFPEFDRVRSRLRTIKGARGFLRIARVYALIDLLLSINRWQLIDNQKLNVYKFRDRIHFKSAREYIVVHYCEDIDRDSVASHLGMDSSSFSRFFRRVSGQKFNDYLNVIRIREAAKMLAARRRLPIATISKSCGYSNLSVFNSQFRKRLGMTPRDYRRQLDFEPVAP